jgi:molybdopterin molybdotransferase
MSSKTNVDCCADGHDAPALKLSEALSRILAEVQPVCGGETLAVRNALCRVLSADVVSKINVPSHTNSAMDGYAVIGADLPTDGEIRLEVIGTSAAGRPFAGAVASGQCARIMTGAPMPAGTDTVVMQENVVRQGDAAIIGAGQKPGQHVRQAGEDIAAGNVALRAGTRLMPAEIGILGSLGVGEVSVRRRPRVAFFSTGDELRSIGEPLGEGQIYDSNRYTIFGMLIRLGVEPLDMGVIRDDRDAVEQAFGKAAAEADAIVTSGGVSVGDADYVAETLQRTGTVGFWKVAMKPGRPLAFGGNPNSVMATFYQLVQPALQALAGIPNPEPPFTMPAISASALRKKPGRREFQRGVLSRSDDGRFIVLPEDSGPVSEGDEVAVQPFAAFV